jgi:type VI secretion system protein VasJ
MPGLDDQRIGRTTAPLPADARDPAALRYEPEYEALEAEMGKLERSGPATVDWQEIARSSQEILATRSKDLSVATWLALALAHIEGQVGLAVGLAIVRSLVENFWDALFPKRPRARAGALEWLITRLAREVPAEPPPGSGPASLAALEELEALEKLLSEKLPDPSVSFGELLRPLQKLAEAERRAEAEAEQRKTPSAAPAAAGTSAPPPAIELAAAGEDPERVFSVLREAVRTQALQLMEANLLESRAFRLLRAVTWIGVTSLPPAQNGRTALMAPPDTRVTEFEAMRGAGNQKDLVLALERFCSGSGLFWLNGQRLAANALATLGPPAVECGRAVVAGTALLLERLPGLAELSFADGTPFADGATRAWIETSVLARSETRAQAAGTPADVPWQAALVAARRKMAEGEGKEALALLSEGASAAPSGRARFHWRLGTARLCLENGTAIVALPLLQHLARLIDAHGLDEWEPQLAAEAASLLHRCAAMPEIAKTIPDAEREEIVRGAFARIARTDPLLAAEAAKTAHA